MMGNGRGRGEDQSRDKCAGHDIRVSHSCSMFSKFKIVIKKFHPPPPLRSTLNRSIEYSRRLCRNIYSIELYFHFIYVQWLSRCIGWERRHSPYSPQLVQTQGRE